MTKENGAGTVVSTRVRLARNVEGYVFPSKLDAIKAREIIRKVTAAISGLDDMHLTYMSQISPDEAERLVENHLISPDLVKNRTGGAVLINGEEFVSIMINEEDHLREQCIVGGLDFAGAYATMSEIDDFLAKSVRFSYDERLGYLTACPTNLGTGLRASAMLFLPALTITNRIQDVINSASSVNLTVRGMYGEGSRADGYMYQLSNERTLGLTEQDILEETESAVKRTIELEEGAREYISKSGAAIKIKDQCLRSFGIATNCAMISSSEFDEMCTNIKLGAVLGYIDISDVSQIDTLSVRMKASNINAAAGKALTAEERDLYRAEQGAKKLLSLVGR